MYYTDFTNDYWHDYWLDASFSIEKHMRFNCRLPMNIYHIVINNRCFFLNRTDGPAFISHDKKNKEWFRKGISHRIDGKAIDHPLDSEIYNDFTGYFICGKEYQEEEYWEMVNLYKEDRIAFKLKYGFDIEQFFDFKYEDVIDIEGII